MKGVSLFLVVVGLIACSDKTSPNYVSSAYEQEESAQVSSLVINEFSPKSEELNEFGEKSDWIEIYNSSAYPVITGDDSWTLTDDQLEPFKFSFPDTVLQPGAFLLVWCDDVCEVSNQLQAPFKLAASGETIYLIKNGVIQDQVSYNDQIKKNYSFGRAGDGEPTWKKFSSPTPGASNKSLENYAESL